MMHRKPARELWLPEAVVEPRQVDVAGEQDESSGVQTTVEQASVRMPWLL
jgi:hypothetical protein